MARKFLYLVAFLTVLVIAALFAYRIWGGELVKAALVPSAEFVALPPPPANAYDNPDLWLSRPGLTRDDPSQWLPAGVPRERAGNAAIFFIHPTSYLDRASWNATLDNQEANDRAALFLRGQASAFSAAGEIWAPRYRQATFGAFLTTDPNAGKAFDLAYRDVRAAFDRFLEEAGPDRPIIVAGHSQGALHLTRLLRDWIAGTPIADRVVAAYVVGWPVSRETDLAALGLPECAAPEQPRCVLGWQSFGEPAEYQLIVDTFDATTGFNGATRKDTAMICTNPLTGAPGEAPAPREANRGGLVPTDDLRDATLTPGLTAARCADRGFLLLGAGPEVGPYVLPGNNYHVYDYSLFWANVREDASRRLAAWEATR